LAIVQLTMEPGASVAEIARAHDVNANQVFKWRRLFERGQLRAAEVRSTALLPISISGDADATSESADGPVEAQASSGGAIHIELPGKAMISAESGADSALHIEIEFLPDLLGQLARSDGLARHPFLVDKRQHRASHLVWTLRTPLPRYQAGDPSFLEAGSCLMGGRPRHSVLFCRTGHRRILYRYTAQHLVLDLHDVVRIEELAPVELQILDLSGVQIQRALFGEGSESDAGPRAYEYRPSSRPGCRRATQLCR
jgi:transposase